MNAQPDHHLLSANEATARFVPYKFANFEEALAWFRSQNPQIENNNPEELDWQAIKEAGRCL